MMRRPLRLLILGFLAACSVGPDYKAPKPPEMADWHDPSKHDARMVTETTDPDPHWWGRFGDPVLTSVMQQAMNGNLDLQQAVLRVVEATQSEVSARAAGLPTIGANASYNREQLGLRGLLESQGVTRQLNNPAIRGALGGLFSPVDLYQYGLNASWELDLFGRVRRSEEQAHANTQAQVEATNDALIMLEGQVADAYVQLRGAQALYASQQDNVHTSQEAYDLTRKRAKGGLSTDLDVEQARTQVANTEAQLPTYEKQAQQALNRLSVLTGQTPGTLDTMLGSAKSLPATPPAIGIGVPSMLARRRPDIRQAEGRLHAATVGVGVAVANFYPDLSLTGNFGLRAVDASFLTNWASSFYAFGPSISLPIFQGGRLTANLRLAKAQQAEAALAYRSTVLNAMREVEDALVAYRDDRASRDKTADAVRSGQVALSLARDSYSHGLSDFIQVLDAERTLIGSRQQLVQANVALTNDVVALYNALGGGWQDTAVSAPAAPGAAPPPPTPAAADTLAASPPH